MELRRSFPELFNIAVDKEESVGAVMHKSGEVVSWNPTFRRNLQDWEFASLQRFFEVLYAHKVEGSSEDSVLWNRGKSRVFSVKSFYKELEISNSVFPWKAVWKTKAPPSVAFFMWEAAYGAILTGDNLWARKKIYVNWCYMCKGDGESVNHLLLHCPVAKDIWDCIFSSCRLRWVMPRSVKDLLLSWSLY